ncbi:MAG: hypothetical protein HYX78_10905 [Armatimonadetes bacterium]|nr:hypothetical protein [Armatimonadota bacterium]
MTITKQMTSLSVVAILLAGCGGGSGGGSNGGTVPLPQPGTSVNLAPTITSISPDGTASDPVRIPTNGKQRVVVAAQDPDNDDLTYSWSVDHGTIVASSPSADYTAPASPTISTVTIEVSDGKGHSVSGKVYFSVYTEGNEPPAPGTNYPPSIDALIANPDKVEVNGTSTITATVTDPEGDPVSLSWSTNGGGITSYNGNTASWKAPSTTGSCTVTCFASDGKNPAVSKSVDISVGGVVQPEEIPGLAATYIQNDGKFAHPDLTKGKVVFTRTDATINFDWGRKEPDTRLIDPIRGTAHDFGVIWRGYIRCQESGVYNFQAYYDDGFRLWISDDNNKMQLVLDGWWTGPTGPYPLSGQIRLDGKKSYKIEAQFFEDEDRCYVQLYWMPPQATQWRVAPTDKLWHR